MPKGNLPLLRTAIYGSAWAILEDGLEAIAEVVDRRASGVFLSAAEIAAFKGERKYNGHRPDNANVKEERINILI